MRIISFMIVVALISTGCSKWRYHSGARPVLGGSLSDPARLTSFSSEDRERARVQKIEMVYSDALSTTGDKRRLFVTEGRAFNTILALESYLLTFRGNHRVQFILEGSDVAPRPDISWPEIDALVASCRRADVWFTFSPGG